MTSHNLRVTVAVHAKYHAFRLCEGLARLGALDRLYTLYPPFKIPTSIPRASVRSFSALGAIKFLNNHLRRPIDDDSLTSLFDLWVAHTLQGPFGAPYWIFNGYSGFCERSLIQAKRLGAITCVERACPHIDEQTELIEQEKAHLLNKKFSPERAGVHTLYARMKREYDLADYIIVPSQFTRQSFLRRGFPEKKIVTIPLCNEKEITRSHGRKDDIFTVLSVAGHFYRKGLFYLLSAWKELKLPRARLRIRGSIPDEFRHLLDSPGVEIVRDHLSDSEMNGLYGSATIFVLASIDEGFGMVVVEAMRAGLPVIVTTNVGAADILRNEREGFIVPARSIDALKDKIRFLYEHPRAVGEMGNQAYQTAQRYTPYAYAARALQTYSELARSHPDMT